MSARRRMLWTAACLSGVLLGSPARAAEVEVLRANGPVDKRFNIAVLGDGYRAQDQELLKQNAQAIIDYVFEVSPLKQYQVLFNVKLVHVISNENGADNGSFGAERDTALDAHFNCGNIDRLLCVNDGKTQVAAAQDVPEYNFAIVLVNDPKYGGSGGPISVSSSNDDSFEVVTHEIGHSLAGLADEYSYEGNQPACDPVTDCPEANATLRTPRAQIKWRAWFDPATPVPTPDTSQYAAVVGLFEGARYTERGVYRPQQSCKMRDLGAPYCAVCSEQFVRWIWTADNVQMIESALPPQRSLTVRDCEPLELRVTSPEIKPLPYSYRWFIDGATLPDTTNSASLPPVVLRPGDHEVVVEVKDTTTLVRSDPQAILEDSFSWTVKVVRDDCGIPGGAAGAGGSEAGGASGMAGIGGVPSGGDNGLGGAGGGAAAAGSSGAGGTSGAGGSVSAEAGGGASSAGSSSAGVAGTPLPGTSGGAGAPSAGGGEHAPPPAREKAGCGCSLPGSAPREPFAWLGLAGVGALLRRRARR